LFGPELAINSNEIFNLKKYAGPKSKDRFNFIIIFAFCILVVS